MSDNERKYQGANYKVACLGRKNIFSKEEEFTLLDDALAYQLEMQKSITDIVVVNEAVVDRKGEFVGWKRLERKF